MDVTKLLGASVESAERPKPLPEGTFLLEVSRHEFGESAQKKTPFVRFFFKIIDTKDDVDKAELEAVKEWQSREPRRDYYLTDNALYRLREFIEACGVKISGRTFQDAIPETTGSRVWGYMRHTAPNEEGVVYNELSQIVAVD